MRDPRNAFRPHVVQLTDEAREKIAAAHFDLEAVRDQISAAALRGEGSVRLSLGKITAELRGTEAAQKLAAWCESCGLRLEWSDQVLERPNGLRLRTKEAVIGWSEENHAS